MEHTHIISIEKEKPQGECEECEDEPEEDNDSEQHGYQDEEGGPICFMGWQTKKASQMEKGSSTEHAPIAGRWVTEGRDCWSEREQKTETWSGYDNYISSYKPLQQPATRKEGKFVNVCDSQSFALQLQAYASEPR